MDQKQLENVEYFNCLSCMITNIARCTHELNQDCHGKRSIQQEEGSFHQQTGLLRKKQFLQHFTTPRTRFSTYTVQQVNPV